MKKKCRRKFIKDSLTIMGAIGVGSIACNSNNQKFEKPILPDIAPDGPLLKAGLIGCGSRGIGAAANFLNAGPNLQVTALADLFPDQIDRCRKALKQSHNIDIPDKNCFVGFDAYKYLLDSGVDVILEVSLAPFRPGHVEAAMQARKHVFFEKPAAVDPVGIRSIMASGKMAESAGLTIGTGTQFRHQRDYMKTYSMVKNGAIGDLISANCYRNGGPSPHIKRQPGWSDMEAMVRDRTNWCWLSGDVIVTMGIHQIDVLCWFFEKFPVRATGFGGRHRRVAGDMYDFFSVDYHFDDKRSMHSMSRQIAGCDNKIGQVIYGTKGYTNCQNTIYDYNDNIIWEYDYPLDEAGRSTGRVSISPYDQEIINLVTAIRTNNPINEALDHASSTLVCIMGRESAYTGKDVTWEEMMNSNLKLGPEKYSLGEVKMKPLSPVPGLASAI
jgi:myo-inositol 2-dehydrogenase / D-chiro-inositol 1-dehydrogenase